MRSVRNRSLTLLLAGTAACSDGDATSGGPVVRDSAGIRIVENSAPAWSAGDPWQLGPVRVTFGTADGAPGQSLHRVAGAVRLSDGSIVIADGGSRELRRYAQDGTFMGAAGREGEGPGEFAALGWVGRTRGDSLLAWDRGLNRISVFTAAGEHVREYQPQLPETPMSQLVRGHLDGGDILLSRGASFIPMDGEAGLQRQPITAWLIAPAGTLSREIGPFPGEAVFLKAARGDGTIRTPVPFGGATLFAAGGEHIYVADNARYDVRVYDADGRLVRIVRRPHKPLPLRPADIEAFIEARLAGVPPVDEIRAGIRASLDEVPRPDVIPPVRSLQVDAADHLWIEAGRRPDAVDATWSVFDPAGVWLGDLTLPAGAQPLDIGTDYLLVLVQDEMDVESVRFIELRRG